MKFLMPILLILILPVLSCYKEQNTFSNSIAKNNTVHKIEVRPFRNGIIDNNYFFSLLPNEAKKIYYNNTRGLGGGVTYGRINQPMDSFIVTFDNLYSIVHYKPPLIGNNPKRYLYNSRRNLYNDTSYLAVLEKKTKYSNSWEFTYTFTEQDYLDAK